MKFTYSLLGNLRFSFFFDTMDSNSTVRYFSQNLKRIRHKCFHHDCDNREVQGGLCITHGARRKRKLCSYPDCTKAIQRQGFCTKHGNSKYVRRKCTHHKCDNRVVNGGVCIIHGAKRIVMRGAVNDLTMASTVTTMEATAMTAEMEATATASYAIYRSLPCGNLQTALSRQCNGR